MSAANPENGTVSYTWNADGTLLRKTDAKGQKVEYSYDGYKRVTQVRRYKASGTEETCQRADLYYDSNPLQSSYSQNSWGRLTAAQWGGTSCTGGRWSEMYSYTAAGRATKKRLVRGESPYLEGSWTWDNEGRMVSVTYPNGGVKYTYTYDTMGRPVKLTDNQATPKEWVETVAYNAAGQMTAISYYMASTHWWCTTGRTG